MIIRAKAPLRISFAGGGTDVPPFPEMEGGCVLNATINRFAWGSLQTRTDGRLSIESVDMGLMLQFGAGEEISFDGQLDLAKAAILRMGALSTMGFDVFMRTEAPPGSGLGSSSALMVALVAMLKDFLQVPLTPYQIAQLAFVLEREDLNIKGGYQDQYAAAFGGFNFLEIYRDGVVVNPLRVPRNVSNELEHNLLLCYTGSTRKSDNIIKDQTARLTANDSATLQGLRAQKDLAVEMKNVLMRGNVHAFGELMHTAWRHKKQLSPRISNSHIEEVYEEARKAGAIGGKITGAGGGGYMLLYCPFEKKHVVANRLSQLGVTPLDFAFDDHGVQTWRVHDANSIGSLDSTPFGSKPGSHPGTEEKPRVHAAGI